MERQSDAPMGEKPKIGLLSNLNMGDFFVSIGNPAVSYNFR